MLDTVDRDLHLRAKDVSDALNGRIDYRRFAAMIIRLIQAADHLGSAAIGVRLATQLADREGLARLLGLFGQSERALDNAALTLGTVSVHSCLDLCAGVILAVVDGTIPRPGCREKGIPQLRRRAAGRPLPGLFSDWLNCTVEDGRYDELEQWRDPQTHRPVPKAVFGTVSPDRVLTRGSVRIYRPVEVNGREVEQLIGTAEKKLPTFLAFGQERFLALTVVLRRTYAPEWRR